MSNYTISLKEILQTGRDIFHDFTYTRTSASRAIVSDTDLQKGFEDHFYFREIGFETIERFEFRLRTLWTENLGEFDKLLVAYASSVDILSNNKNETKNTVIINDTPKNSLDIPTEKGHASNISQNISQTKGANGITDIELLELYHDKIKDIQTEFYNKFEALFMQIF